MFFLFEGRLFLVRFGPFLVRFGPFLVSFGSGVGPFWVIFGLFLLILTYTPTPLGSNPIAVRLLSKEPID